MPTWATPPTFVDGQILSASQLNTLSNNLAYLQGLASAPNVPVQIGGEGITTNGTYYLIRHRHDKLLIWYDGGIDLGAGGDPDVDDFHIVYDSIEVASINGQAGENTVEVDISSFGLVVGQLYTVEVEWDMKNDSGTFKFYWREVEP